MRNILYGVGLGAVLLVAIFTLISCGDTSPTLVSSSEETDAGSSVSEDAGNLVDAGTELDRGLFPGKGKHLGHCKVSPGKNPHLQFCP